MTRQANKSAVFRSATLGASACAAVAWLAALSGTTAAPAGAASLTSEEASDAVVATSTEEGQTPLDEAFDWRAWRLEKRREALKDTQVKVNLRTYYLDRNKYDGSESEAWAIGGSAGLKTGYFLDHIALGVTGYTSQPLYGPADRDGTLLLAPGQDPYTVLGELYTDIRIIDNLNLFVGRKEFDTPFINRNDTRMTPNTFEAITLQGRTELGEGSGTLKYGVGYFDKIKERNSDEFVPMSEDAGASVDRGVFTAGGLYQNGKFSFGAIDYYSADIIHIFYTEAKYAVALPRDLELRLALQFADQRSTGDDLLQGDGFSAHQLGIKAEVPVGPALFTAAYTQASGDADMRSPWSGYPGYTSVQVEDFFRDGEGAFMLRAGYNFPFLEGFSTYALWVHGSTPDQAGQYARDEYDFNLQYVPPKGTLKGLSLRLRYAIVDQHGGNVQDLNDFRAICSYELPF